MNAGLIVGLVLVVVILAFLGFWCFEAGMLHERRNPQEDEPQIRVDGAMEQKLDRMARKSDRAARKLRRRD